MNGPRSRKRRFQPIGAVRPAQLGLSRKRTRALGLAHAWRTVAGAEIAEQTTVALRRGVFDVVAVDATWLGALEPLMPEIAARLRNAFPELAVEAWRLTSAGAASGTAHAIPSDVQNA